MTDPRHQPTDWRGQRWEPADAGTAIVWANPADIDNPIVLYATGSCARELENNGRELEGWADCHFSSPWGNRERSIPSEPGLYRWTGYIRWNDPGGVPEGEWSCTAEGDFERLSVVDTWALRMGTIGGCPAPSSST